MRTTLNLDEDILEVAKQLAEQRQTSLGKVISELVRQALEPKSAPKTRNGVPLFTPKRGVRKPTLALVNKLLGGERPVDPQAPSPPQPSAILEPWTRWKKSGWS